MKAVHAMSGKQVQELSVELLAAVANSINAAVDDDFNDCWLNLDAADIRAALDAALAAQFAGAAGGVVLVWWDRDEGVRLNVAGVPAVAGGGRRSDDLRAYQSE